MLQIQHDSSTVVPLLSLCGTALVFVVQVWTALQVEKIKRWAVERFVRRDECPYTTPKGKHTPPEKED